MRMHARRRWLLALMLVAAAPASAHEPDETPEPPRFTAPVLLERVDPIYPRGAHGAGLVGLELAVAADGSVTHAQVERSAGKPFDDAAVAAALKYRFRPASSDGAPVAATVELDVLVAPGPPPREYASSVTGRATAASGTTETIRNTDWDLRPRTAPGDVLRAVPGLLPVQHQGGGKADQLFLRGFDADHGTDVALYIDGVPINLPSHAHGQGYADLNFVIPEALERVDVQKGPYDVRWGDFATAGAVNLITRDRFEGSSAQYTLGLLPSVIGREAASGRFLGILSPNLQGRFHPFIAAEIAYDNGPFTTPEGLVRYNLFTKLAYDVTPALTLGLFVQGYGAGWTGSGQIPERDVARIGRFGSEDPTEGGQTERQMITAFLKYRAGDQELTATVYVTRYRLKLFNDFTFFLNDPVHGDEIEQDDTRVYSGARLAYHVHRRWRGVAFRTTVGAELRWDDPHVERWHTVERTRLSQLDSDDLTLLDFSAWAEEDMVFNRFVRAVAGLRLDYLSFDSLHGTHQEPAFSPKLTLIVAPLPRKLELYAAFGMGFHTNQAAVAVHDGETQLAPDGSTFLVRAVPRLFGGDVGVRAHLWDRIDLAAAFFASYLENETVFDADLVQLVPSAPTRRLGFDFTARARIVSWLHADFDLSQSDARYVPGGEPVALAPRLYITGGFTLNHPVGVRAGAHFRYFAARPAFEANDPVQRDTDPWFVLDVYLAYRWRMLEIAGAVQNLLDSDWREAQLGTRSCMRADPPGCTGAGVADIHFTPGTPFNLQLTGKIYF